jgi:hypothetical protein
MSGSNSTEGLSDLDIALAAQTVNRNFGAQTFLWFMGQNLKLAVFPVAALCVLVYDVILSFDEEVRTCLF